MGLEIADLVTPHAERPPVPIPVDWPAVEAWLDTRLPADYKQLADTYGPMEFGEYIWIHVPCVEDTIFDYGDWLRGVHRDTRIHVRGLPEDERPAVHPAPGGLLALGMTWGSDYLFWDTSSSDDPDEWTVVVRHGNGAVGRGFQSWQQYDLTLGGYLRHTLQGIWDPSFPHGQIIGPLQPGMARTTLAATAEPWTPPEPVVPRLTDAERRVALETGSGLDALRLLTPPPVDGPYLGDDIGWEELFARLGTKLPGEYITLMELYGFGCWRGWLRSNAPLRTHERGLLSDIEWLTDIYRSHRAEQPDRFPMVMWPEPGGFLPFADTIGSDYIGWLTDGDDPDAWPITVWSRDADQVPPLELGLIDTLVVWLRGEFGGIGLPGLDEEDDPLEFARHEAWDETAYE